MKRKDNLSDFFCKGKGTKIDIQKMKDDIRRSDTSSDRRLTSYLKKHIVR